MTQHGANGLKLTEIAEDVGITHPLILHYFGSKQGLIDALIAHIGRELGAEIASFVPWQPAEDTEQSPKVEAAFRVLSDRGFGRLIGWSLQQHDSKVSEIVAQIVTAVIDSMVQARVSQGEEADEQWLRELRYWVCLTVLAAIGESVAAPVVPMEKDERPAFRRWLGGLISERTGQ